MGYPFNLGRSMYAETSWGRRHQPVSEKYDYLFIYLYIYIYIWFWLTYIKTSVWLMVSYSLLFPVVNVYVFWRFYFFRPTQWPSVWIAYVWKWCTPKPNGFADHYPVFKWLFHWEYTLFSDKPKYTGESLGEPLTSGSEWFIYRECA